MSGERSVEIPSDLGIGAETDANPSSESPTRCGCPSTRNLVVCVDGTLNQFSVKNTNVVELYSRLEKDDRQLTYYNSGIGTYVKDSGSWFSLAAWKQAFNHSVDMMIAWNFKEKVLSAYRWLSENYKDGDRIFLFGFSRGAYQVRVIAGMIRKVGLLHKGNNEQIPLYDENQTKTVHENDPERLCANFKKSLSKRNAKVHFVGVWDTVSSIGIFRGMSLPETTSGMRHVCVFRQALALDELRVKFLPEYVNGGMGPSNDDGDRIKEVWFAGSHSDIGGGNVPNVELDYFGPALRWMSYEAIEFGLRLERSPVKWSTIIPNPSMTWYYKLLEYIPVKRLSYKNQDDADYW
ncbi:hypothetical protein M422DRAFT_164201 [Sphaerobolus stellatus SS14]|nr:hypothetical protein M422DRAFT_164201 [Sphaerobolus stellatus SS14]